MHSFIEQWSALNKNTLVSAQKFADINTSLFMNLAQQHMDMVGICVESGNKQVQALSKAKRIQDVFTIQPQLVEEFNKKVLNNIRVSVDVLVEAKNQLTTWAEDNVKQVAELNPLAKQAS